MTLRPRDRARQTSWLLPGSRIRQDQDLLDFIKQINAKKAIGVGDISFFSPWIEFVDSGPVDLCICVETGSFDMNELISRINDIALRELSPEAWIYLSFNKYQIQPRCYDPTLPSDFDEAIRVYVTQRIESQVHEYRPCGLDGGNKFNWVHPLTRFYLRKTS